MRYEQGIRTGSRSNEQRWGWLAGTGTKEWDRK